MLMIKIVIIIIAFNNKNQEAIDYCKTLDPNADGVQINLKTSYMRLVYREIINTKAVIDTSDLDNKNIKRSNIVFINAFSNNLNYVVSGINKIIANGIKEESLPLVDLSLEQIRSLEQDNNVTIKINNNKMVVSGMNDDVDKIKSFVLDFSVTNANKIKYPNEWTHSHNNLEKVELNQNSPEFKTIYNRIKETVADFEISKIERIQNKHLWKVYQRQIDFFKDKGVSINETSLFHGTGITSPELIYDGEIGFQTQFASAGMWGRGIYFAVNASYSKSGYTYRHNDGTHSLLLAKVALGDFIQQPSNSSYVLPPEKPQSSGHLTKVRYDSIKGNTDGSDIFIIYENGRAYPEYLITFKR